MQNKTFLGIASVLLLGLVAGLFLARTPVFTSGDVQSSAVLSNPSSTGSVTPVSASNPSATPVEVHAAAPRDMSLSLSFQGTLSPDRDVYVIPKMSGTVTAIYVDIGDRVEAGDIMATIDDEELRISEMQAAAAVKAAQAQLSKVKSGARPEEIEMARAQAQQAKVNLEQAETNHRRVEQLYASGSVPKAQFEQSQAQYDVAFYAYEAAKSQLTMVELGAKQEDVDAVEAQLAQAQAALDLTRLHLGNTVVKAPVAGTVATKSLDLGHFAAPGSPAFQIIETDPIVLRVDVGGRDVVKLTRGLTARIYTDIFPGRIFEGTVHSVDTAANPASRLFGVTIKIPNPDGQLRAGMSARVDVAVEQATGAIAVPDRAILPGPGVFVASNGRALWRPVTTGITADGWTEIKDGIAVGENVIVSGQTFLDDGESVRIIAGSGGR